MHSEIAAFKVQGWGFRVSGLFWSVGDLDFGAEKLSSGAVQGFVCAQV